MDNSFLDGNELIEAAIDKFLADNSKDNLIALLEAIRQRMHADGHFLFPVLVDENDENSFSFRSLHTEDGKLWHVAFTSHAEYEKGEPSQIVSNFIDSMMKGCLDLDAEGFVINPWGNAFFLTKDLMRLIFDADGDVEYTVPDDPLTPELLEGGEYLKRVIGICNRNRTELNMVKLMKVLRDSWIWIPCTAIMSDADKERMDRAVAEAEAGKGVDSLVGQEFTSEDEIRLVPDILKNGENYFFPVFTSADEMGEYGQNFSKVEKHFFEAANMAINNEKDVVGIVINAYSEPFIVPKEMFDVIAEIESSIKP